jgi:hypothetical protein
MLYQYVAWINMSKKLYVMKQNLENLDQRPDKWSLVFCMTTTHLLNRGGNWVPIIFEPSTADDASALRF